eukprot:m.93709 g.93709  ORF g.93709 m.93709 type:complete len:118 (-) comp13407_c0_seq2:1586-1939(-)
MAQLRSIMLMVPELTQAVQFFNKGLGLKVLSQGEDVADLDAGGTLMTIRAVPGNEAVLSPGYSTFLNFNTKDMDTTVYTLLEMGARLDGPILYPTYGKIASVRSPTGHMIGLFEPSV